MKGRTFKLCVLTRWDFNFCVRSSPLRVIRTAQKRFTAVFENNAATKRLDCTRALIGYAHLSIPEWREIKLYTARWFFDSLSVSTAYLCYRLAVPGSYRASRVASCPFPFSHCLMSFRLIFTLVRLLITKNHTIPLSVRTRLSELLCVFNCSLYFSSCKTACDLQPV